MKRKMSSSPEIGSTSDGTLGALFDVFLSFRGLDTRTNFTDTLYYALLDKGIRVFIDKKGIGVGEEIGPEIFHAIDDSKICIPIFSKGYASSRWCLRELEHMMQRRKTNELEILPVFYDVEPSDVKLETRVYRDALTQHKKECGVETVQGWEDALKEVTKIKGWDAKNKGYGELAHLIARKVSVKLKVSSVYISDELVGTDESVNEIVDMLNVESKDIRIIGIWGMGGIGKTTLAKVVYSKLSTNFESHSFISDIREASKGFGLLNVQRQLISNIIGDVGVELSSIDHGMNMIKDQFCRMKVLIFLDDVDHASQLMALAAKKEWFGMGSRIVVTTRNKSVLCKFQSQFEHCLIYEAKELNNLAALRLFSKHAFRSDSPPNAFLSLSTEVITKTGGLPLAIEVIGSFLCGKTKEVVWQDTLEKMDHLLHEDVKEKLMLSYEKLDHPQKQIFLDIACFLSGKNKSYATYMWDDCGFFPEEGIDVLLLMSLVKIGEENTLWMHDQLKDLGKSIVHQEYYKDPRKGSRVWELGGPDIVQNRKGIKTIAMYCIPYKVPIQDSILTSEDLNEVPNIRFLTMSGSTFSGDFGNLFLELRWLTWNGCPKEMQATNFSTKNLVILDLSWSFIDEHWGGWTQLKVATKLKVLNLLGCDMLKETPDLFAFLSLEILILGWCRALTKLPNSIGMLKCLIELDVSYTSIIELPNTIVNLKSLKVLKMNQSYMQKLPEAIGMMEKLEEIYGEHCAQLKMIPSDIVRLSFLKTLKLTGTHVENVPKLPESLVSLYFSSSAVEKVMEIFNPVNLPTLRNLELCFGEDDDETFVYHKSEQQPHAFYSSVHMKLLSSTSVSSFGGWLHCTGELELNQCKNLHQIQQLPSSLRKLKISDCNLSGVVNLSNLENLLELRLTDNRICAIQGLERLKNLQLFKLWMCRFLQTLSNLCNLKNLKDFELVDCPRLVEIEGLDILESLERLDILFCGSLQSLPDLSRLKKLKMSWW
ncbi:hypothetical protein ACJRO7_014611 [Eucalyptus globulus]|uniref:TIR domain-containing protein n=1 Tax=Eucalyptus globulus TaxID=34317 RepID=A0ABD3L6M3_EUCGL